MHNYIVIAIWISNFCFLTGYLPMSQKVVQIQNRQFSWNLCQSTLSWSRLTTQNIFGLWWPFLAVAAASISEATNKINFFVSWPIEKPISRGEHLCKSKLFHQVTDWDRTNWPIGSPPKWLWKQVVYKKCHRSAPKMKFSYIIVKK